MMANVAVKTNINPPENMVLKILHLDSILKYNVHINIIIINE